MKYILSILLVNISIVLFGQNRHLTIGVNNSGICFGNSIANNGLRINLVDKNVETVNGIDFSVISKEKHTNGIKLTLYSESKTTNGLGVSIWALGDEFINGIGVGVGVGAIKINGIGIGLIGCVPDTINGVLFGGLIGANTWSAEPITQINGISISFATNFCKELNGVAIGMNNGNDIQKGVTIGMLNKTEELYGIQIGLWNVAKNKKRFKRMPFINMNFKNARR
jgi:hypothetical protein